MVAFKNFISRPQVLSSTYYVNRYVERVTSHF